MSDPTRRVLREMLREEWRMHVHLFGGRRFSAFPVFVAVLVAGAATALELTGTSPTTVLAGLHGLAFVFGLHTGSLGFVGRDALRNVLGGLTLVVFSARTLPLSRRRLLGVFVLKDVLYYAVLFLLPMAVGVVPVLGASPLSVALLWATLVAAFVLGIAATLVAVGLSDRRIPGAAVVVGTAVAVGLVVASGFDAAAYTPYGVFVSPTPGRILGTLALVAALFALGAVTFDPTYERPARTAGRTFRRWRRRVPGGDPLATKTLLDVHRSSGGFVKVLFSAALLLAVTAALVDLAGEITGVAPSVGVSFGTVLGLTAFTTYNWLTQFDSVESYLAHPIDVPDVYRAKLRAFLALGPLVGLAFYAVGVAWVGAVARPLEVLTGGVLLVGVACYSFGVTVYLTGLSPNEFLFDTVLFAVFTAAIAVPLVPVLVVGFVLTPVAPGLLAALVVAGVALGGVGLGLFRRALPKWRRRHRR